MSTTVKDKPNLAPRPGRWRPVLLGGLLALGIGGGIYLWSRSWGAEPRLPDLAEVDAPVKQLIEESASAVRRSPRSGEQWGRLGMVLHSHGFSAEAADAYARAERCQPQERRWPYLRGLVLAATDFEAAAEALQRAASLPGEGSALARAQLAELALRQGRLNDAEAEFQELLRQDPHDPRVHLGLGRLARLRRNLDEAVGHLRRCTGDLHTRKAANILLAEIHQRRGEAGLAEAALKKAQLLPPDAPWPDPYFAQAAALQVGREHYLSRAARLRKEGTREEQVQLLHEAEARYRDLYWLVEGQLLAGRGDLAGAESALRKAVELEPRCLEALLRLGEVLLRKGDAAGAGETYEKALQAEPAYGPAHLGLARCYQKQGKNDQALESLRRAVQYMPLNAEGHRRLGEFLVEQKRFAEAIPPLENAVRLAPADAEARQLLDRARVKKGR